MSAKPSASDLSDELQRQSIGSSSSNTRVSDARARTLATAFGFGIALTFGAGFGAAAFNIVIGGFGIAFANTGFGAAGSSDGIAQVLLDALQPLDHEVKEVAKSPLTKSRKW